MDIVKPWYVVGGKKYSHEEIVTELKKRIRKGRRWARDRFGPQYYKHIDSYKLSMQSFKYCILGQLFGGYFAGLRKIFPGDTDAQRKRRAEFGTSHGFFIDCIDDPVFKNVMGGDAISITDTSTFYAILGDLWIAQMDKDRLKYGE